MRSLRTKVRKQHRKQTCLRAGHASALFIFAAGILSVGTGHATYILADQYAALAWADGHTNYAISAGYPSLAEAEKAAAETCERQVPTTCSTVATSKNGVIVLAIADDGSRLAIGGPSRAVTRSAALQQCMKQGRRCQIVDELEARSRVRATKKSADKGPSPDLWGTVAWRADLYPGNVTRIWSVSQHQSQQDAIRAALQLCEREEQAECTAKAGVRNVFLAVYVYRDDARTPQIESDISTAALSEAINWKCSGTLQGCAELFSFDVRKPVQHSKTFDPDANTSNSSPSAKAKRSDQ